MVEAESKLVDVAVQMVRGNVLRSAVVRVRAASICYRAAIVFDGCLPSFVDEDAGGYQLHSGESRSQR